MTFIRQYIGDQRGLGLAHNLFSPGDCDGHKYVEVWLGRHLFMVTWKEWGY